MTSCVNNISFHLHSRQAELEYTPGGEDFELFFAKYMDINLDDYEKYDPNLFPIENEMDEEKKNLKILKKKLEISRMVYIKRFSPVMELVIFSMIGMINCYYFEKMKVFHNNDVTNEDFTDYIHDQRLPVKFIRDSNKIFEDLGYEPSKFKVYFKYLMGIKFHLAVLSPGHLERTPEYEEFLKFMRLSDKKKNQCFDEFSFLSRAYDNASFQQVVNDFHFIRNDLGPFYRMMCERILGDQSDNEEALNMNDSN